MKSSSSDKSNLEAALLLAAHGKVIFPVHYIDNNNHCTCGDTKCGRPGKHPMAVYAQHGKDSATNAEKIIRFWWTQEPRARIGLPCKENGFLVLDVDDKNGHFGSATLKKLTDEHGELQLGPEQATPSGGRHIFFDHPDIKIASTASKIGDGLDVRSDAYVITGDPYKWIRDLDTPLPKVPEWLLDLMVRKKNDNFNGGNGSEPSNEDEAQLLGLYWLGIFAQKGVPGKRNQVGHDLARQLYDSRVPYKIARSVMVAYAETRDQPKGDDRYSVAEALLTLNGVYNSAQRDPANLNHVYKNVNGRVTVEDIAERISTIKWAWEKWLPQGMLTMIAGAVEVGKSWLALRIAQSYITGEPWPDGTPFTGETGEVLWIDTEASQAILIERLKVLGLFGKGKIILPFDGLTDINLAGEDHQAEIVAKATLPSVKLIVIDSLRGAHRKDETAAETYFIEHGLAKIARDAGKPLIVTQLLRKRQGGREPVQEVTIDDVRGNSSLVQSTRVVIAVIWPDKGTPDRIVKQIKNNIGQKPANLGYMIDDHGVHFSDASASETAEASPKKVDVARRIISQLFNGRDEILAQEAFDAGLEVGVSEETMNRARRKMGISANKIHRDEGDLRSYWYMPIRVRGVHRNGHSEEKVKV